MAHRHLKRVDAGQRAEGHAIDGDDHVPDRLPIHLDLGPELDVGHAHVRRPLLHRQDVALVQDTVVRLPAQHKRPLRGRVVGGVAIFQRQRVDAGQQVRGIRPHLAEQLGQGDRPVDERSYPFPLPRALLNGRGGGRVRLLGASAPSPQCKDDESSGQKMKKAGHVGAKWAMS